MTFRFTNAFCALVIGAALPLVVHAQSERGNGTTSSAPTRTMNTTGSPTKPGRAPNQAIDEAYTAKIKQYTTEPYFLSPLVDYLPASKTVPTPTSVLGDIAGAPTKLPNSKEVYAYMRALAKATPRVKVVSIGTTEEGREMIAVAVASESLMTRLDENRAKLAKLADPRTIAMNDETAEKIAADATPIYYVTGTIHSPEVGAPTALMEMAYRLAVDDSPYIKYIRDHLITLITPIVEVDGRDRQVDVFNWHMAHPNDTWPNLVYWGHYVAHDNNRDAMGMTLKLSQNVLNTYVGWKAQVIHDLHESVPFLYDNTIGDGPFNAWIDPLLTNEWQMIGWNNVQEMTRFGMPGVFAHGYFDTWSPGYLMFMAATHNGISRLYETFGNGGTAETVERTLSPSETERTWYRQNPPLPHVKWSLRNNNNYEQTGVLVSLNYFANNRQQFLWNFYEKSKRSILKARTEGPAAYVFPADERRTGAQAELLRVLQKQAVELSRSTGSFTVPVATKSATPGARSDSGAAGRASTPATRTFPAGSYIVRMDQPYSRIADALLDYQFWSPEDPQKTPYDDTGWTFPEGFGVEAVRVTDPSILNVPVQPVTGDVKASGSLSGTGSVFAINNNADNALLTLRFRMKAADFQAAEESFEADGKRFSRGSFIIRGVAGSDLEKAARELGLNVTALGVAPDVKMHPLRAPRIAILHNWISTQTEGWWRQAFDFNQIPFDYISTQDVAKTSQLSSKWDVILFPPAGGSPQQIVLGMPMYRNPMPWKNTPETPNLGTFAETDDMRPGLGWQGIANLQRFVEEGGVLVGVQNTADVALTYGLAYGATLRSMSKGRVVGSLLRSKLVDTSSPITYGIADNLAVFSEEGQSFGVSNTRGGGRGFRFGDDGPTRATGRGTADDPDVVQGRAGLDSAHMAPVRKPVSPWELAPLTDEQMRNPLGVIPPDQRPRVVLRFADQKELLVSGLLDGAGELARRPVVVDIPLQKGHVVLFANNPIYRGSTLGSYALVFNTIMNWDHLNAGRVLDAR
ncbi:MAG: M14 family zinc carboxypeptidase [Gemmatimonadaceae bacterium]